MTLTVKIDDRTEREFVERCRQVGESKSAVVRRLIERYLAGERRRTPAEVYDEVTGGRVPSSDGKPLGRDHSHVIKARLRAGYRNR